MKFSVEFPELNKSRLKVRDEYLARAQLHGRVYQSLSDDWEPDKDPIVNITMHDSIMDLYINGPLDWFWGVDSQEIIDQVEREQPTGIRGFVDSPGGVVAIGQSLYNYFMQKIVDGVSVDTVNMGMVASAAVMPFLAGTNRYMPTGTNLMTHEPRTMGFVAGTKEEIEQQAKEYVTRLDQAYNVMSEIYAEALEITQDKAKAYFDSEQWFSSTQAKDESFATSNDRIGPANPEPSNNDNEEPVVNETTDEQKQRVLAIRRERMRQELGL